ncbi:MAG TPA: PHB depolymerase family esterase [Terriglobales bacterium]|nr:PHB depolymerase family esterase [Terriglobales bacterium]
MKIRTAGFFFLTWFLPWLSFAQDSTPVWRYSLRAGDHLVYSETIHRLTESSNSRVEVTLRFRNHVVVVKELEKSVAVGMQRNREDARLISYRENGKDKLAREEPKFAERVLQNPGQWSEANWFSASGTPKLPWAAVRESNSRLLAGVHEIESLPSGPVKPGDKWESFSPLGFRFQYLRPDELNGELCKLAQGEVGEIRLRYWFCPSVGAIAKVELEGDQSTFAGKVHESVVLELREIRHGEALADWIASPETRLAALRTVTITPGIAISREELAAALESANADAQVLALAIVRNRGLPLSADVAERLGESGDARVRRMTSSLTAQAKVIAPHCSQPRGTPLAAQVPGTTIRYSQNPLSRGDLYLLHVPEEYSTDGAGLPLLVYLSGGPGLAIDAANGAENVLAKTNFLVLYPNANGRMWWREEEMKRVDALLSEVLPQLNVDRSRVYLAGFSNGGTGALYYATHWPARFSAVAALMGGAKCIEEIQPLAMKKLAGVPVLLVHGDRDPIIPSRCSEEAFQDLRKISPESELHVLKGREHDIVIGNDDGLTVNFLEKHSRCSSD